MSKGTKIFFLSDLHLGAEKNQATKETKYEKIDNLFEYIRLEGTELFLLGDVFDFWYEYKHAVFSEFYPFLHRLSGVIESGVTVHFIGGNHDFWGGDFLRNMGITVYDKPIGIERYGKKIFMAHGDGFAKSDWGYRNLLVPVLRNRVNRFLFSLIHPDMSYALGRLVSGQSREYTTGRYLPLLPEYENYAQNKIDEGFDAVVLGHTHYPRLVNFEKGVYIDTGEFFASYTFVEFDGKKFCLKTIKDNEIYAFRR